MIMNTITPNVSAFKFSDLGVIVAVAVAGALVVFFNGQKGK